MSFTLVLNSKNSFGANNNTYKYVFIRKGNSNIPPDSEGRTARKARPASCNSVAAGRATHGPYGQRGDDGQGSNSIFIL